MRARRSVTLVVVSVSLPLAWEALKLIQLGPAEYLRLLRASTSLVGQLGLRRDGHRRTRDR